MKHPVRETLILVQLFLLINNTIKKTNMKNWKTSLFGLLVALCGVASTQLPQYKDIFVCAASLFTALAFHFAKDSDVTGGTTLQGPGSGVAKAIILILGISFTSEFVNAQGPAGTLNLTRQGQTVTGNAGDVQFMAGGVLATQSGFNYNYNTKILSIDSVALNGATVVTVDTTVTDTVILKEGFTIVKATGISTVVLVLPYTLSAKTVQVRFTSNVGAASVIVRRVSDYAALYPASQYLNPTLWAFGWAGAWY